MNEKEILNALHKVHESINEESGLALSAILMTKDGVHYFEVGNEATLLGILVGRVVKMSLTAANMGGDHGRA